MLNHRPLPKLFSLLCLFLCAPFLAHADDFKNFRPTGFVSDRAGVIDATTQARLETLCLEVQQKTGVQIAVITEKSLDGRSVEESAVDIFKQLGVGGKKDDRGVLLLLAPTDRKYRIEVGYGLEPVINDARVGDIGRSMVPTLRKGDYSQAAESATWQIAKFIADDAHVTLTGQPPRRQVRSRGDDDSPIGFLAIIGLIIFFIIIGAISSRNKGGRGGGSGGSGLLWFILGMLINSGGSSRGGGGWGGGGFGGGGSGGGGFGGFGGGSSGGGGASGSW